ncbi:unnamed protein product [Sympodiomycopsis kandeliae]
MALSFSWPSLHTATSYLLLPLITHHILLNRVIPSSESAPINGLSPSELDHSFTSFGLQKYPLIQTAYLAALTVIGGIHVAGGVGIIAKRWSLKLKAKRANKKNNSHDKKAAHVASDTSIQPTVSINNKNKRRSKQSPVPPTLLVSASILTGVWAIARDSETDFQLHKADRIARPSWIVKRFDAVYQSLWPYSMFR